MGTLVRTGNTLPVWLKPGRSYRQGFGFVTQLRKRGLYSDLFREIPALISKGVQEFDLQPVDDSPFGILSWIIGNAQDGSPESEQEPIENVWTKHVNFEELELRNHPKGYAIERAKKGSIALIESSAEAQRQTPDSEEPAQFSLEGVSETINRYAREMYDALVRGVDKFPYAQVALRNKRTVSNTNTLELGSGDGLTLFTSAALAAYETTIPPHIKASVPAGGYWRQMPETRDELSNGKFQLNREYWHFVDYEPFIYQVINFNGQ